MTSICRVKSRQTVTSIVPRIFNSVLCHQRPHGYAVVTLLAFAFSAYCSSAAEVRVKVIDRDNKPVEGVVVTISDDRIHAAGESRKWIMDQVNLRFVPQVLVVPAGAVVDFPNSDTVSHQVYSFSKAKSFQLPLYKGRLHPPITFDKPGLVVLGCNIHDEMIGYIYVTAARWFGRTGDQGVFTVTDANSDRVTVTIWSPYIADAEKLLTRTTEVHDNTLVEFKLGKSLRNAPEPRPRNPEWDY
jgi:plastocyanin